MRCMVAYRISAVEAYYDATMREEMRGEGRVVEGVVGKLHASVDRDSCLALATRAGRRRCLADVWAGV